MSNEESVRARAIGAIHNISADAISIGLLLSLEIEVNNENSMQNIRLIPILIELLRDPSVEICQASAGTLTNLSRDLIARNEILSKEEPFQYLSDLLCGGDLQCQVTILLNLFLFPCSLFITLLNT